MFSAETYKQRRKILKDHVKSGVIYFPGNDEAPMNYGANTYKYRQDSTFLYYFGIDSAGHEAVIDVDNDLDILFGDDRQIDDVIWMGPELPLADRALAFGVEETSPLSKLADFFNESNSRKVHFLPQYRADNILKIEKYLGIHNSKVNENVSVDLIKGVVAQRSIKSEEELMEIEKAIEISYAMNTLAMKMSKPGKVERDVFGAVEGLALSLGSGVSFPIIFSVDGERLHNHHHENIMEAGRLLVLDSGAESPMHYASDITRTFPVNGKFTDIQRDIYNIVLNSHLAAIDMMKPGIPYRDVHLKSALVIAEGLTGLGFMKGNPEDAVKEGAHALFFPHGLGHMLGLDVHDMENLGENYIGYTDQIKRSDQFGLAYLRMGKPLEAGHVLTVEPGIYFINDLIRIWKNENKFADFINYDKLESMLGFGGIRIEDDVVVTEESHRILGRPIPKTIEEVEETCSN